MRECYRAQKLGNFSMKSDWKYASNVVLKKYIEDVDKSVLFEDITLQMESKIWANEYNRRNPPKKIDVMQICIVQLVDRADAPFFQMENFIDGEYVKYNSNSGFIGNDRMTPQTFSHFTFEVSNRGKMVIDIQGVNDLWTDPQIHSANGLDYGDGNLGVRGMALFFLSHTCSTLCDFFNLTKFEKHESEEIGSQLHKAVESTLASLTKVESQRRRFDRTSLRHDSGMESLQEEPINPRIRHLSACSQMSDDSGACGSLSLKTIDEEVVSLSPKVTKEEILFAIHYAVCQLYCQERIAFSNDASVFHLKIAAEGGHVEALTIYGRKLLGIQTDVLEEIVVEQNSNDGFKYLEKASTLGDSYSTFLIASAYQSGDGLPDGVEKNWEKSCTLLTELIDSRTEIGVPVYKLMEEKGKMLQEGGNGLEQNATDAAETFEWAAEEATCAMKGKQAAKYFEMAEIAWSLVE
ncbi:unnamed protein product [Oikopleura dioica]|uniref:Alpha-type protein kinase domain-containing protein n=1 Tax=Oikopleura dioica TaxID=34765 RepID=E4YEX5_OIKDI|nr:unnamed protein product [Oikopleura dioica]